MYNDTIKVANKIITSEDLSEILATIHNEIEACKKQYAYEKIQNEKYNLQYQNWTLKDYSPSFKVNVNFYDDTEIAFDNYYSFMAIFNSRLEEIKDFSILYSCSYFRKEPKMNSVYVTQHINIDIYETKMNLDIKLDSSDTIMNNTYEFIKNKILKAQPRYDEIIKNKNSIVNKISFAIGFIPVTIILAFLLFYKPIRYFYAATYILFPIADIIFSFAIGTTIIGGKLEKLYDSIIPDKKYSYYSSSEHRAIYEDDLEKFTSTSEILIGKNVDNLEKRRKILQMKSKYEEYLKYEIAILLIISILAILIGKFI